jgi:hypothetical protein
MKSLRHPMMHGATAGLIALLLGVHWQPAFAAEAKVRGSWADGASHDQTFTRVLVVAITPDVKMRCEFERFLAARLNGKSTKAVSTCDALTATELDPLTVESIKGAVEWLKADAVVATSLVAREWSQQEGGSRDTRGTANYKATDAGFATGYYGVYGVPVVYGDFVSTPPVDTLQAEARLTTKVYATRGPTVVYTLDTTVKSSEFRDRSFSGVTIPMADRLRKDGLIN